MEYLRTSSDTSSVSICATIGQGCVAHLEGGGRKEGRRGGGRKEIETHREWRMTEKINHVKLNSKTKRIDTIHVQ